MQLEPRTGRKDSRSRAPGPTSWESPPWVQADTQGVLVGHPWCARGCSWATLGAPGGCSWATFSAPGGACGPLSALHPGPSPMTTVPAPVGSVSSMCPGFLLAETLACPRPPLRWHAGKPILTVQSRLGAALKVKAQTRTCSLCPKRGQALQATSRGPRSIPFTSAPTTRHTLPSSPLAWTWPWPPPQTSKRPLSTARPLNTFPASLHPLPGQGQRPRRRRPPCWCLCVRQPARGHVAQSRTLGKPAAGPGDPCPTPRPLALTVLSTQREPPLVGEGSLPSALLTSPVTTKRRSGGLCPPQPHAPWTRDLREVPATRVSAGVTWE